MEGLELQLKALEGNSTTNVLPFIADIKVKS